jgi:hypothetical protein
MHADWDRQRERRDGPDQPSTPSTSPTGEGLHILAVAGDPDAAASHLHEFTNPDVAHTPGHAFPPRHISGRLASPEAILASNAARHAMLYGKEAAQPHRSC